jgi:hypothetical protein
MKWNIESHQGGFLDEREYPVRRSSFVPHSIQSDPEQEMIMDIRQEGSEEGKRNDDMKVLYPTFFLDLDLGDVWLSLCLCLSCGYFWGFRPKQHRYKAIGMTYPFQMKIRIRDPASLSLSSGLLLIR